jgi:hypothetical protein
MPNVSIGQILTESQLMLCVQLYSTLGTAAVGRITSEVMEPNIDMISEKAGQPCDPRYLAYACIHAIGAAH